jgi:fatty-acid O-methyltransferase
MPQTACGFSFENVAPLDWFQWRSLLWDHLPGDGASSPDWQAVADVVNKACPDSSHQTAGSYRRAFEAVRAAFPEPMPGSELWTRSLYDQVPALAGAQPPFMNLGYCDQDLPALPLAESDEPFRLQIQLYKRALAGDHLAGKRVVEVGCGGGGGVSYLARTHQPAYISGIDLLENAIQHCRSVYSDEGLRFEQADAASLPFENHSVDAVINIESSGHYPSLMAFLEEVQRILRPASRLYLADLRATDGQWGPERNLVDLRLQIESAGLIILKEQCISPGVLRSIDLQEDARRTFLNHAVLNSHAVSHFEEIMLMQRSRNYARLRSGRLEYCVFVCERREKGAN